MGKLTLSDNIIWCTNFENHKNSKQLNLLPYNIKNRLIKKKCLQKNKTLRNQNIYCTLCRFPMNNIDDLTSHIEMEHLKNENIFIPDIQLGDNNINHEVDKKEIKIFTGTCDVCGYVFLNRDEFNTHRSSHINIEEIYNCDICYFNCDSNISLKTHMADEHPVLKVAKPSKTFKCNTCDFKSKWKRVLVRHVTFKHAVDKSLVLTESFSCDTCNYETRWKDSLRRHKKRHLTQEEKEATRKMHQCDMCGYVTPWREALRRHFKYKHVPVEEQLPRADHKCDLCPYTSKWKEAVTRHFKYRHTDFMTRSIKEYQCDLCIYKTKWKESLKRHKKTRHHVLQSMKEISLLMVKIQPKGV